jgi:uncharacterized protein (DUF433 family)
MSEAEDWRCRITVDPEILAGKPVVKGARISVEHIVELLANGWTIEEVLENHPPAEEGGRASGPQVRGRGLKRRKGVPPALTKPSAGENAPSRPSRS